MVKKKKEDFMNYVNNILQNSMLTGIPQIVAAGNWKKRIVRTLVFFMCVTGFIYQSMSFMKLYWEYQVVVDVRVLNPMYAERPSVTICNRMGFKSEEFCDDPEMKPLIKELSLYCEKLEISKFYYATCECTPRMCDLNGNVYNRTYLAYYADLLSIPRQKIHKFFLLEDEIITGCQENGFQDNDDEDCEDHYYAEVPCNYEIEYPEVCFTRNTLIDRPNYTNPEVYSDGWLLFRVSVNEKLYPKDIIEPFSSISIHNPYTVLNPFYDGFRLRAGHHYHFYLRKVTKELLPHPYVTDCIDYITLWKARGGRGPTNMKECKQECKKNASLEMFGCSLPDTILPGDEVRCMDYIDKDLKSMFDQAKECAEKNCKPACYEESYLITHDVLPDNSIDCYMEQWRTRRSLSRAVVKIFMSGMETTVYKYSPKFEDIETFSYLGGYVGMWLGISLVAVFDFLETVFAMIKYPIRKCRQIRDRRRKINHIRKFQRDL